MDKPDLVEVVRCRFCKHYRTSPYGHPTIGWCMLVGSHKGNNYYCADGVKKSESEEVTRHEVHYD